MTATASPPARWWHEIENKKVVCRLCPRECHIPNGSRGFCFVRANVDGHLELTTYGRSSGFCIDPVEKKPLNHFLPGTPILSFGTAGCNLGCKFCQNWDISKSREVDTLAHQATPEAIVEAAVRSGCRSLAFTYNDPVIWAEYAIDIAKVAHARGLKTVAVTAGYISREARGEFYQHMDAANVDLKAFTDFFYSKLCQVNLEPILDTLKFLKHETNVWFELTNLMIPGENDSTEETTAMCAWIVEHLGADVPVHFTAFHPDFKMRETPPTPPATLVRARQIAIAAGIRYAFVGNVNDAANQSTYCHGCGKLLIERNWYEMGAYNLRGNACGFCGTTIPGVFDAAGPGKWGSRRQPIIIGQENPPLVNIRTPAKKLEGSMPVPSGNLNVVGTTSAPAGRPVPVASAPASQIDFTPQQDAEILAYARAILQSHLHNELFSSARLPDPLAQAPTFGLFVSLFRGKQLRSCKGQWGSGTLAPLNQILAAITRDAAANDPRFPRITAVELPQLTLEISLMHDPQPVTATGEDRVAAIHVGTHGIVIMHPNGSGLLLPHVATEARWDSRAFLEAICQKAGLPAGTWRDPQARLMTFRARKITDHPVSADLDASQLANGGLTLLLRYAQQLLADPAAARPPEPSAAPALHRVHPENLGVCLQTTTGISAAAILPNQNLLGLVCAATESLKAALAPHGQSQPVHVMSILSHPMPLIAADYPARLQHLGGSAVMARVDNRWTLVTAQRGTQTDPIAQALSGVGVTVPQWAADRAGRIAVIAFSVLHCQSRTPATPTTRPAHCAGQFYPASIDEMTREVDAAMRAGGRGQVPARACRAIMLPHAGWRYCGATLAKTLAQVQLPRTAIILGPRHTPHGPACSVAAHAAWDIPGAAIPIAVPLAQRLARAVPGLAYDAEAHRQEHGTEVLLPFLARLRSDVQVVPIVLGQCTPEFLDRLAAELSAIAAEAQAKGDQPPLLIISSDMNHFANEAETQRRDALALDAMKTGDPRQLFEACAKNDISMCGLLPAVVVMEALRIATREIRPEVIDHSTSAMASGDWARVVGYAGVTIA